MSKVRINLKYVNRMIEVEMSNTVQTGLYGYCDGKIFRKTSDFQIFVKPITSHTQEQLEILYELQSKNVLTEIETTN